MDYGLMPCTLFATTVSPTSSAKSGRRSERRITDRAIHLVLENDLNQTRYLQRTQGRIDRYDAQWNDDLHHALHVLVTDDRSGYYADYAIEPAKHLGRALAEGLAYQGEPSPFRGGKPRGEPLGQLPATAFVSFLQNHDQVGNHPFGARIAARAGEAALHAAVAIMLLSPQIPLLFMGEEWASRPSFCIFLRFRTGAARRQCARVAVENSPTFPSLRTRPSAKANSRPDRACDIRNVSARLDRTVEGGSLSLARAIPPAARDKGE